MFEIVVKEVTTEQDDDDVDVVMGAGNEEVLVQPPGQLVMVLVFVV